MEDVMKVDMHRAGVKEEDAQCCFQFLIHDATLKRSNCVYTLKIFLQNLTGWCFRLNNITCQMFNN